MLCRTFLEDLMCYLDVCMTLINGGHHDQTTSLDGSMYSSLSGCEVRSVIPITAASSETCEKWKLNSRPSPKHNITVMITPF